MTAFWAIGSGQTSALGYLFSSNYRIIDKIGNALFHACYAKFYAESAPGVGKKTIVTIIRPDSEPQMLMTFELEPLRKLWEQRQKRKVTKREAMTAAEILGKLEAEGKASANVAATTKTLAAALKQSTGEKSKDQK